VLWARPNVASGQEKYLSISAQPFAPVVPWRMVLRASPGVMARLLPKLNVAASAMAPFDTWLGNADRPNPGNVVLHQEQSTGELRVAYIDFANALPRAWLEQGAWSTIVPVACYPPCGAADLAVMSQVMERIEQLAPGTIKDIVERIPQGFLSGQRREVIVEGLLHRQTRLRMAMKKEYPGLP